MLNKIKAFFYNSPFLNPPAIEKRKNLFFQLIGHLFFIVMFILAWVYYKERMITFDGSFYAFKIIHFNSYNVEVGRYGAILTQILPYLFFKNGCSLETFLRVYSVSFVLINYLFFCVILYVLRNKYVAIAFILSLCLAYRYVFYYTVSETHQAYAPCLLFFALVSCDYSKKQWKKFLVFFFSAAMVVFVSYVHNLFVVVLGFILIYEIIRNNKWKDITLLSIILFTIIYFSYVILTIPPNSYSAGKIPSITVFLEFAPKLLDLPITMVFYNFIMLYYKILLVLVVLILFLFIIKKKFLLLTFYVLFLLGYTALILVTFRKGESPVMQENYYMLFGIFIAIPLTMEFIKKIPASSAMIIVVLLLTYSVYKIWKCHFMFTQRNDYIERIISYGRTFNERKFVVNEENLNWDIITVDWDLGFESLLLSSIPGPDSALTFYTTTEMNKYDKIKADPFLFITVDFAPMWFGSKCLKPMYFGLKHTVYRKLNSRQDSTFNEAAFTKDSVRIALDNDTYYKTKFFNGTIPVKLTNLSKSVIPSTLTEKNQTYLSYHLYKDGEMIQQNGRTSRLEVDLLPGKEYVQGLFIDLPQKRGKYTVEVDMRTEKKRWWGINKRFTLVMQ